MNKLEKIKQRVIREINDELRINGKGGRIVITSGVLVLGEEFINKAIHKMKQYNDFSESNDPYKHHDFGCFQVDGKTLYFKIDNYSNIIEGETAYKDHTNCATIILTLMLQDEY